MNPIREYLKSIEQHLVHGDATEHTHRPAMQRLLEQLAPEFKVTNEPKHIAVGAPDFVIRQKISKTQWLPIGYVETKDINAKLDEIEKSEQLKRYLKLDNLLLTDYLEFRWYVGGKMRTSARLASPPARGGTKGGLKLLKDGEEAVRELLRGFLTHEPLPISSPQELAKKMASLCRQIDGIIVDAFKANSGSELLSGLKEAFERTLLPDLTPEQFADMFTQTLAYGLFAARINHFRERPTEEFRRSEAAREIPKTNPFLRKLFDTITGADIEDERFIDIVNDLTAVMQHADIGAILHHFGRRTGQEDPVVHFYETFLAAYDPKLRELRGVYYTPEPVVSYIVRSVDILLKEKFGLKDGLADRSTIELEIEEDGVKKKRTLPKVLILDPACGTGTFLYAVIDLIRKRFMESDNAGEWSDFVREHLLPRIYGFELLMAPYAVAHLKLAMQLSAQDLDEPLRSEWAYDFRSEERLNIYLTNSLEMTERAVQTALFGLEKQIAEEANAARSIKMELPIMVVLGNPPYSANSANKGKWIEDHIRGSYYPKDEMKERNPKLLLDDYVKFIRFGQWRIERTDHGILAYISNHAYLDNPTFRGMRQNLMHSFDDIYLLDLHGNAKKKEKAPDGGKDENVFDIQQGVAIGIFLKGPATAAVGARRAVPAKVGKSDAFGLRERKYRWLFDQDLRSTEWTFIEPIQPFYLFLKQESELLDEYGAAWKITDIISENLSGVKTHRDHFVIDFDRETLEMRISAFLEGEDFNLEESSSFKLSDARKKLLDSKDWKKFFVSILYRPFDERWLFYHDAVIDRTRREVMRHMLVKNNLGLITVRQVAEGIFNHVMCTRYLIDNRFTRSNKGIASLFPLYLYSSSGDMHTSEGCRSNFAPAFIKGFSAKLGLTFIKDGRGDLKKDFGPEDVFDYIYAVFHSPTYRSRYAEFLKIDFPRVPLTSDVGLFRKLVKLGDKLVKLHLLEDETLDASAIKYPVRGDHTVEKVRYVETQRQVWINSKQYFEGVPPDVWQFHIGGYQVAEKWLKDRKGRTLSSDDRAHYRKIIATLRETIVLMQEIDKAIPKWPIE